MIEHFRAVKKKTTKLNLDFYDPYSLNLVEYWVIFAHENREKPLISIVNTRWSLFKYNEKASLKIYQRNKRKGFA